MYKALGAGCLINVTLLDFFWWKTWVLKSLRMDWDYWEGMRTEVTTPHMHPFFAAGFQEAMGITLDDLYASKASSLRYDLKDVWMFQLKHMLEIVNKFNDLDSNPNATL